MPGAPERSASAAPTFGALVVTGRRVDRASSLLSLMNASRVAATPFPVSGEPTIDDVVRGAQSAKMDQCDMVVGFGGGSAIDAGKAIAAFMTNEGDILDYLEVIGQAKDGLEAIQAIRKSKPDVVTLDIRMPK